MNVLILGASGFLGGGIIKQLSRNSSSLNLKKIRLFCRNTPEFNLLSNSEVLIGDFQNKSDIDKALAGIDVVVHLISSTTPATSNLDSQLEVTGNLLPTIQLLDLIPKHNVKKVIFASSGGTAYGDWNGLPSRESFSINPLCNYGIFKITIEKLLLKLKRDHNIAISILRISNPYGINQRIENGQGALSTFLKASISRKKIEIWGDGNVIRDYVHIDDVADAFIAALAYEGDKSIFNIGSGIGVSLNELIDLINLHRGFKLAVTYKDSRVFDLQKNILDISLAKSELNWIPKIDISSGICLTLEELLTFQDNA